MPSRSHLIIRYLIQQKKVPEGYEVGDGHPAPTIQELKQFFRWLIQGTQGRLAPDGIPTRDTVLNRAQEFVPGFYIVTGNEIARNDRDELYRVSVLYALKECF